MNKRKIESSALNDALIYECELFVKNTKTNRELTIAVKQDNYAPSPREWDNLTTMATLTGRWGIGEENYTGEDLTQLTAKLKKDPDVIIKPLFVYEHGGITVSLNPFKDPWDSGCCGIVYAKKNEIIKELSCAEEEWKEKAEKMIKNEVEILDDYLTGNVHKLFIYNSEGKLIDSYGGLYGDVGEESILDLLLAAAENDDERSLENWDIYIIE